MYALPWWNILYRSGFIVVYGVYNLSFVQSDSVFTCYKSNTCILWRFKCRHMR